MLKRILAVGAFGLAAVVLGAAALTGVNAQTGPDTGSDPLVVTPDGRVRVLAPIESAAVQRDLEGPVNHSLHITAGLPSGCAERFGYQLNTFGNQFYVQVYNTMPIEEQPCTMIYGTYDLVIGLHDNLIAGQQYRMIVNGEAFDFTA